MSENGGQENLENQNDDEGKSGDEGNKYTPPATQEDLDKIIQGRLTRAGTKHQEELQKVTNELDALKAAGSPDGDGEGKPKPDETDADREWRERVETLERDVAERDRKVAEAEYTTLLTSVASTKGVPASALVGETREELEAKADELIEWAESRKTQTKRRDRKLSSGAGSDSDTGLTDKQRAAAALRGLAG